jgi:hypothetical protein
VRVPALLYLSSERDLVTSNRRWPGALALALLATMSGPVVSAQSLEVVGSRALGMGGAFVAVANDSTASWWNPAGLGPGPFLDVSLGRTSGSVDGRLPAARTGLWSFALGAPPFGVSYYNYRLSQVRRIDPTAQDRADREDLRGGVAVHSLSVSQFGATILQTLVSGVHVGSTVKYVRATPRRADIGGNAAVDAGIPALLDRAGDLSGGEGSGTVDLDIGVIVVAGALRGGAVVRNVREPEFDGLRLPRQVRIGAAFDGELAGLRPFIVSLDADVHAYDAGSGERRVIAVGGEHWLRPRRLALRAGTRVDTAGAADAVVTAGASVAPRAGFFVDGHVAVGGTGADSGWGLAARVSF